jgi:hypothetical protein
VTDSRTSEPPATTRRSKASAASGGPDPRLLGDALAGTWLQEGVSWSRKNASGLRTGGDGDGRLDRSRRAARLADDLRACSAARGCAVVCVTVGSDAGAAVVVGGGADRAGGVVATGVT